MNINNNILITEHVPLHDKNWFATGGPARYFATPTTAEELHEVLLFAQKKQLELFILGKGANILISDNGFDGLVIQPQLKQISLDKEQSLVTAGAGVSMDDLIEYCLHHHLIGLEEFSGIPGTVGGSVFINLHYFNFLLEQFIVEAQAIDKRTCEIKRVDRAWFQFGYNHSRLHTEPYLLVDATFQLTPADDLIIAYARGRRAEIIRHRQARYPTQKTCGSFFRNFFDHEVTLETDNGKKMIYVAYYLDKLGIKGQLQVGGAKVSHQHANMLINLGYATSNDILELARTIQLLVQKNYGIIPKAECQLIGFEQYPLL
jgi:UDP-N-acetylmuramate dehydrogenase